MSTIPITVRLRSIPWARHLPRSSHPSGKGLRAVVLGLGLGLVGCSAGDEADEGRQKRVPLTLIDSTQALAIEITEEPDPMLQGLVPTDDAATRGMWSPVRDWPMNGLHSVLLPNGRVLTYGTPQGNAATQDGRTLDVWNPTLGFGPGSHDTDFDTQRVNSFCSTAAFAANGSLLISGGNSPLESSSFAPATGAITTSQFRMSSDRWYGTMITLPDGRFLMMGGSGPYEALRAYQDPAQAIAAGTVSMTPEIFEPSTGFRSLFGAYSREAFGPDHHRYWYPRAWVAPSGKVFGISSEKMWSLDYSGSGSVTVLGDFKTGANETTRPNIGPTSAAVMFAPGKILQVGGNGYHDGHAMPGSALSTVIDINGATPVLQETSPMNFGRHWPNLTVLPTGQVVVTGGTRFSNNGGSDAVYAAELWDPTTETWTLGASASVIRVYHSAAILLPNGTVLSTGGGAPGPVNNLNAEVYYPPYLFRQAQGGGVELAPRPRATAISTLAPAYGGDVNVDLDGDVTVARAVLVGTSSTTHSFNTSQRFLELPFVQAAERVAVRMPTSGNQAPPGYYELFFIDSAGVPSRGIILSLGNVAPPPDEPPPPEPSELPLGEEVTLSAVGLPDYAMAIDASNFGILGLLGDEPSPDVLARATFVLRAGLGDPECVSFESVAVPGQWLRHYGYRLRLGTNNGSSLFLADATFCPEPGLAGQGWSFRSKNYPTRVIRHKNHELWIDPVEDQDAFHLDATFTVRAPAPPELPPIEAPIEEVGTEVVYSPNLSIPGATYTWDFGDNTGPSTPSGTPLGTHVFTEPGLYLVTLTVDLPDGVSVSSSFVQAIHAPRVSGEARSSSQLALSSSGRLWVVNPDSDTVAIFDANSLQKRAEVPVGASPQSVALGADGQAWVVSRDVAIISIIDPGTFAVVRTIELPDGTRPRALVFSPSFQSAYVSLDAVGQVAKVDVSSGQVQATIPVGPSPRGLAISADGARLFVSRFISPPAPLEATTAPLTTATVAEVRVVNLLAPGQPEVIALGHSDLVDSSVQGRGVPNYLGAPLVTPDGASIWVPSKQDNIARGLSRDGQHLDFQNTVRAIISRIDAETQTEQLSARVDLDNSGVAAAVASHPTGAYLFVALETSREVAVVAGTSGTNLFRIPVGRAPQGVVVSSDGTRLYVKNFMDRSVSAFDLTPLVERGQFAAPEIATVSSVSLESLPSDVLRGKQLFYDAADPRLARDAYVSCASCHADGEQDGRVWDLSGFGEGVRNTISLLGRAGATRGLLHWSANFDEVQDFEGQIRSLSGGTGLMTDAQFSSGSVSQPLGDPKAGISADLDALAAYVNSLSDAAPSPYRDGANLTAAGALGRTTFAQMGCNECHYGETFADEADGALIDVGTLTTGSGERLFGPLEGIDVPSLLGVWSTPPYLHDGSALGLADAIVAHVGISPDGAQLASLVAFVSQIDGREPPLPRFGCGDGVRNGTESDVDCGGNCGGCAGGASCAGDADCESDACTMGACESAPNCTDGIHNGDESDVDCGGSCSACTEGAQCFLGADCLSGSCTGGLCDPLPSLPTSVWLEAEQGVRSGSPGFSVGSDSAASKAQVLVPTANSPNSPGPNRTSYTVEVDSGSYVLWGRVSAPSGDDDSFWVSVDGGAFAKWNSIPGTSGWIWDDVHDSDAGGGAKRYALSAGVHTVVIANREDGTRLDMLYLTSEGDVPVGLGPPTCDDGLWNGEEAGVDCGGPCDACVVLPNYVYLAAESGQLSGSPAFSVASNTSATGGLALSPTSNNLSSPGPNRASYSFELAQGSYVVWGRVRSPSYDDDSFYVSMDGGSFVKWNDLPQSSAWVWDDVHNSDAGGARVVFTLAAGTHTLQIANREDGVLLDELFVGQVGLAP